MSPVTSKGIRPEADVYRRAVKNDWQRRLCHLERHPSQDQHQRRTTKVGGSKSISNRLIFLYLRYSITTEVVLY